MPRTVGDGVTEDVGKAGSGDDGPGQDGTCGTGASAVELAGPEDAATAAAEEVEKAGTGSAAVRCSASRLWGARIRAEPVAEGAGRSR